MGKGDDHPKTRADEGVQLALGLGEASGGERRPLSFEGEWLAARQRIERSPAHCEVEPKLVPPQLPDLCRSPDEVGSRGKASCHGFLFGDVREVGPALRRRKDRRLLEVVERPLRKLREGADPLDYIAEELDAEGLAARCAVDVENSSANCDLPTLFHSLDALVACDHELLGQRLQPSRRSHGDLDRRRPRVRRRQALRGGSRRHAHEPIVRQHRRVRAAARRRGEAARGGPTPP